MATSVYEVIEVQLLDGSSLSIRPLKISVLRDFMKKFDDISKVADDNIKSMDVLIECAAIAMKQYNPELATREKLEDVVDLPTVYKIIEVASGIKFGGDNPNLMGQVGLS
jgi:inhibitor of KinA sporulation pathway (predicted exonuclease)